LTIHHTIDGELFRSILWLGLILIFYARLLFGRFQPPAPPRSF
jgi:hypothetical protein